MLCCVLLCCVFNTGQIDAYYQYMLKPYDVAAGIVILEEAGGRVTTADGAAYSVFDNSLLATNDALYEQVRCRISVTYMSVCDCAAVACSWHRFQTLPALRPGHTAHEHCVVTTLAFTAMVWRFCNCDTFYWAEGAKPWHEPQGFGACCPLPLLTGVVQG